MSSSHCRSLTHQDMVVHNVGSGLATVFPDLDGKKINDAFLLARPLVEFTWNMVTYERFRRRTVSVLQLRWSFSSQISAELLWVLKRAPWSAHRLSPTPTTCLRSCQRSLLREKGTFTTESRVRVGAMQTLTGVCFWWSRTFWHVVGSVLCRRSVSLY